MSERAGFVALFVATLINLALLTYAASNLSLSSQEAEIYFEASSFLHYVSHAFTGRFGESELALRAPFLLMHFINVFLLYKVAKPILPRREDRLLSAIIFMFLPGVLASAILVNAAVFIVAFALLSIRFVQEKAFWRLGILLATGLILSRAFLALYLALIFYGLYKKERVFTALGTVCALAWFWTYDYNTGGKPSGHLVDTMGIFGATFSPLIFIYFIYAVYRVWIKESKDFLWFVSTTAFCMALVLSARQKLPLELLLPYCVIFVPHMARLFLTSYRIRLPRFRKGYRILGVVLLLTLAANAFSSIFSDFLYAKFENPRRHFAFHYTGANELAAALKKAGITNVRCDQELALRLRFYGINDGWRYYVVDDEKECGEDRMRLTVPIKRAGATIRNYFVCQRRENNSNLKAR